MSQEAVTFRLLPGVPGNSFRAVGFLEGHRELTAKTFFDALQENQREYITTSILMWSDTGKDLSSRNHGFKSGTTYRELYVFKQSTNRFYGFLCNPILGNKRLHVCVLCIHAYKNERETDTAEQERVERWRLRAETAAALSAFYKKEQGAKGEGKVLQWKKK